MHPQQPSRKTDRSPKPSRPAARSGQAPLPDDIVHPLWLLKALGLSALAAVVCAWLALCLLYYQGSWQLVLHPSNTVDRTPASVNLAFEEVRFDAAPTGQPRLSGWWIPAGTGDVRPTFATVPKYAADTILYLHDGKGSLSATLPSLARLHSSGINVFAFDYRGFGGSDSAAHPTSSTMTADASAAFAYLTGTRHILPGRIVPYGAGLGASVAARLAQSHQDVPAFIVDDPDPDPATTAVGAHPSHIVPIRLLYHENFEIAGLLAELRTPKLLLATTPEGGANNAKYRATQALYSQTRSPRFVADLPTGSDAALEATLSRFLDQYLPPDSSPPSREPR